MWEQVLCLGICICCELCRVKFFPYVFDTGLPLVRPVLDRRNMDEFRKGENSTAIAQDVNFLPSPQGTQQPSHVGATGRVEMPPAYSQMPPNLQGTYNIGQPQGVWNPQGKTPL